MPSNNRLAVGERPKSLLGIPVPRLWLTLALLLPASGSSQTQLGQIGEAPDLPEKRREALEAAKEETRWSWGNTRVQPLIAVRDSAWVRNAFDTADGAGEPAQIDDFTITVAAGLTLFQEIGGSTTFSAWALPEYVWWQDLEDRRRLNGRYGAGLYTGTSRIEVDIEARRLDQQALVTPEVRELTSVRQDEVEATVGVQLYRSIQLFVSATTGDFENLLEAGELGVRSDFDRLNRTEDGLFLGVEANVLERADLRFGLFDLDVSFAEDALAPQFGAVNRDFDGEGWFAEVEVPNDRIAFAGRIEQRELSPRPTSVFPEIDELLGFARLTFKSVNQRRQASLYQRRELFNAVGAQFATTVEDILGGRISLRVADRYQFSAFVESGDLEFATLSGFEGARTDDLQRLGASWTVELPYGLDLSVQYLDNVLESPFLNQDRSIETLFINIGLREFAWP